MSSKASRGRNLIRAFVMFLSAAGIEQANAQVISAPNVEQICRDTPALTFRKTIVYVDLAAVQNTTPQDWGPTILNRLELAPRESLTVISVNPSTFEAKEVFNTCNPAFAPSEIESERKSRGIWSRLTNLDPEDQQRENLQAFDARLRNALNKIYEDAKKIQGSRRNLLAAVALDKNRYSNRDMFYRIIIYSDGTIKDNTSQSLPEASFSGAEISVFGVNTSDAGAAESNEQKFRAFFLKSWAHLKSFSASLPVQERFLFLPAARMDGVYDGGGRQGSAKLALFHTKQDNLANGWLVFNVGQFSLYVPFQGEYSCDGQDCHLKATCSELVSLSVPPQSPRPYFRVGDKIVLNGSARSLGGSLEPNVKGETFRNSNQSVVKYSLNFSVQ
jgi:hypothetical protein